MSDFRNRLLRVFEEVAVGELDGAIPAKWMKRFALLRIQPRLGMSPPHWSQFLLDARRFLGKWGAKAARLGWSVEDVLGMHPLAPEARYDAVGLVPLIRGNEVVAISKHRATIRTARGGLMTYYRHRPNNNSVLGVWELLQ
jgi:hypothetical protein